MKFILILSITNLRHSDVCVGVCRMTFAFGGFVAVGVQTALFSVPSSHRHVSCNPVVWPKHDLRYFTAIEFNKILSSEEPFKVV